MRFYNPTGETLRVAGLAIPPDRTGTVEDAALAAAIKRDVRGTLAVTQRLKRLPDDTDEDKLDRVCAFAIEEGPEMMGDSVTRDGWPTCAYCREVLGRRGERRRARCGMGAGEGEGVMDAEQRHYLDEGNRHRARYYGVRLGDADLTLALAWWCAWWKDQSDRKDVRELRRGQGDLYEAA